MANPPATDVTDPVDPRVARSRTKLLDAATALLVEGGARAVTVDAVAEQSGVAKSTLYRHFPSRTDLLVQVLRHNMPTPDGDLPDGDFADGVRFWLRDVAESMADPDWARILPALLSLKHTIPDINELTEADRAANLESLRAVLARGEAEGAIPRGTDIETVLTVLVGPLFFAAVNDDTDRLRDLAEEVADRYLASCRRP